MIYKVVMLRLNHWGKRLLTITTKKKTHWMLKNFVFNYAFSQHLQVYVLAEFKRSQGMLFINGLASINFSSKLLHIQRQ